MNILLLEDEKLAAVKLQKLLYEYFDESLEIDWVQSVKQGLKYLKKNGDPDLIMSDIELLDGKVFQLYEKYEVSAPIIFTTAYDQYLLDAFKTNGIAYLQKPYGEIELAKALDKYLKLFGSNDQEQLDANMITQLKEALNRSPASYKDRFTIKKPSGIFLLETQNISCFKADDDLVFAFDNQGKKHIIPYRMNELEKILDPKIFFRVNRGASVNVNYIEKMEPYFGNRLVLFLKNTAFTIKTSGPKTAIFRKWIEGE